jgi:putative exporter of polyketide antibiotics
MFKKRYFSAHSDFKTGIFCKISFFIGIILLISVIIIFIMSFIFGSESSGITEQIYNLSQSKLINTILAISILFIGTSIILYFFNCQFSKLSKIADEIEKDEKLIE